MRPTTEPIVQRRLVIGHRGAAAGRREHADRRTTKTFDEELALRESLSE